jgi:hypothetical protein
MPAVGAISIRDRKVAVAGEATVRPELPAGCGNLGAARATVLDFGVRRGLTG